MNLHHFSAAELGTLAVASLQHSAVSSEGRDELALKFKVLARYSRANTRAYNHQYQTQAEPHTDEQIRRHASLTTCHLEEARKCVRTMRTNLAAADADFADMDTLEVIIKITNDLDANIQTKTPVTQSPNFDVSRVMKSTVELLTRAAEMEYVATLKMDGTDAAAVEGRVKGLGSALARWAQAQEGDEHEPEEILERLHAAAQERCRELAPRGNVLRRLLTSIGLKKEAV